MQPLNPDSGAKVNVRGNRHTLLIPDVTEAEFGDYTCEAANQFGKVSKTARVSGESLLLNG